MPSEMVSWEYCPGCAGPVALGWTGQDVTEIDCASGCQLSDDLREAVRRTASPPTSFASRPSGLSAHFDVGVGTYYLNGHCEQRRQAHEDGSHQARDE